MAFTNLIPWKRSESQVPVKREDPFYAMQRHMNQMFDNFFGDSSLAPFETFGAFQPRIDVSETDTQIIVAAELPGLDEKNVEVTLTPDALTITGEKKEEKEDKDKNYYRVERSYGSFRRMIPLPGQVNADEVEAVFKNGVLTITLPKPAEARSQNKKISVKQA